MVDRVVADRNHLSIGEVLGLLQEEFPDITISKIRFLESQGLLDPERTPSGYRKFYDDDIQRLRWILRQQRENFLPLKVIKDRLAERDRIVAAGGDGDAVLARALEPEGEADVDPATTGADEAAGGEVGERRPVSLPPRSPLADVLERRAAEAAIGIEAARPVHGDAVATDVSFTRDELAAAAELTVQQLEQIESYGLITGHPMGRDIVYDGEALLIARLASAFLRHGLEPRHLRMFKVSADREAGLYEQLVTPLVRQRNPESRRQAGARLSELSGLGQDLRAALLRQSRRQITG